MKPDHARASLYQRVTDQIIAELERGVNAVA
jgi:antirestriction protein ArdC